VRHRARIAWLLLGLLALAGAVHAPLHEDGAACSPAGLCSGALALSAVFAAAGWVLVLSVAAARRPLAALAPRDLRPRLTVRGRAPPRG
jgi:hypothetical protein